MVRAPAPAGPLPRAGAVALTRTPAARLEENSLAPFVPSGTTKVVGQLTKAMLPVVVRDIHAQLVADWEDAQFSVMGALPRRAALLVLTAVRAARTQRRTTTALSCDSLPTRSTAGRGWPPT